MTNPSNMQSYFVWGNVKNNGNDSSRTGSLLFRRLLWAVGGSNHFKSFFPSSADSSICVPSWNWKRSGSQVNKYLVRVVERTHDSARRAFGWTNVDTIYEWIKEGGWSLGRRRRWEEERFGGGNLIGLLPSRWEESIRDQIKNQRPENRPELDNLHKSTEPSTRTTANQTHHIHGIFPIMILLFLSKTFCEHQEFAISRKNETKLSSNFAQLL